MQVRELMNSSVVSVSPGESAAYAARLLSRSNIGSLPVINDHGKVCGMVTDRDIVLRCVAAENDPGNTPVKEIMSRNVTTISPQADVREAAQIMADKQVRRLPVVEEGRLVGMISLGDMAKNSRFDMEASKALSEISSNVKKK